MFEQHIESGMAWLDETIPNWKERIDVTRLDLAFPESCILGQVFRQEIDSDFCSGYEYALRLFDLRTDNLVYELGFAVQWDSEFPGYEILTEEWKQALA